MQLKISTDYAIKTILYLAKRGEVITSGEIARDMKIPGKYLINLCASLRKGGLLQTHQGKNGGYSLAKDPNKIRIYDILSSVEDSIKIDRNPEDFFNEEEDIVLYQLKKFYSMVQLKTDEIFKSITIADLVKGMDDEEIEMPQELKRLIV